MAMTTRGRTALAGVSAVVVVALVVAVLVLGGGKGQSGASPRGPGGGQTTAPPSPAKTPASSKVMSPSHIVRKKTA